MMCPGKVLGMMNTVEDAIDQGPTLMVFLFNWYCLARHYANDLGHTKSKHVLSLEFTFTKTHNCNRRQQWVSQKDTTFTGLGGKR